jgi:XTP/dITP diphosphohydrolase
VHRHPHIYGDTIATTEDEVKANWEKIKLKEGKTSVLEGVPSSLPAMVKASRIQEKVKGIGFEWDNKEDVWEKVKEELEEFHVEHMKNSDAMEEEFGDILFSLVNYARFVDINPENALARTNQKFINRFKLMETMIRENGDDINEMNLQEMDVYWDKAKKQLKSSNI